MNRIARPAAEILGWLLLVAGAAALVLPGPGLLGICAGLTLLAPQHPWAVRRLAPLRVRAIAAATDAVRTWPRITGSAVAILTVVAVGVVWFVGPAAPTWWPLAGSWWLVGGRATGATIIGSALLSATALVWSVRTLRMVP